ncbi:MAG: hypothetical protein H7258_03610 [Ferruginibacter sp.]|nr:hypothetical protein [Ferruginibacter sp.]
MNTKYILFTRRCILLSLLFYILAVTGLGAQPACYLRDTLFSIDFGSQNKLQEFNLNSLKKYHRDYSTCPNDGFYAFPSMTSNCFNSDWITLNEDHTLGDVDGKMMLVNASETAGDFFIATLSGFKPGTDYEFAVWMLNVCKINGGCQPLPPDILITLESTTGKRLAEFPTGKLYQSDRPFWKRYYGLFTCPADNASIVLKMSNTTDGGCGNDFAMDDITIRACYPTPPQPIVKPSTITVYAVQKPLIYKPEIIKIIPEQNNFKKNTQPITIDRVSDTIIPQYGINRPKTYMAPMTLLTRINPVIKQIEEAEGEIFIELYDNGEIDGDTVSIYHNNELIVSRKGLSEKPISFKITVSPSEPYHEIVMVADNLGSIPPNTSLMIVKAKGKRYEIFISSSEQKNAKVIIKKKE